MARNGSGTYSLVSGNPVTTGSTISSTWANNTLSDIATALTGSIAADGQTTITANLPMSTYKHTGAGSATASGQYLVYGQSGAVLGSTSFTGAINVTGAQNFSGTQTMVGAAANVAAEVDVASSGTTDIGGAASNQIRITGTTTITSFGTTYAGPRFIRFAGILTLTHNGTSLILPGAANITTAAGDTCIALPLPSSAGWYVSTYIKASGAAVVAPSATAVSAPIRQTVSGGPTDSSGYPNLSGSTGSTTVTTSNISSSAPLAVTAAYGFDNATGKALDYFGFSTSNLSWTGLSTNGTMYLYVDVNTSTGALTTGSTTLLPVYQWGGTYSTTNLQNTYSIQEGVMKVGNGATASAVARVFVGEVTVAGNVVTSITWYAYNGRYVGSWVATLPGTSTKISQNHNLGVSTSRAALQLLCTTTDNGYSVNDIIEDVSTSENGGPYSAPLSIRSTRLIATTTTGNRNAWLVIPETGGSFASMTAASWSYRFVAARGW